MFRSRSPPGSDFARFPDARRARAHPRCPVRARCERATHRTVGKLSRDGRLEVDSVEANAKGVGDLPRAKDTRDHLAVFVVRYSCGVDTDPLGELTLVADYQDLSGSKRATLTLNYIFHVGHRNAAQ